MWSDHSSRVPDTQLGRQGGLDSTLAADIARAQSMVDVAVCCFDLESVAGAPVEANKGGERQQIENDHVPECERTWKEGHPRKV